MAELRTISQDELKQKMDRGEAFHLVDALAPEKYRHSHLPKAINIPVARVRELAPALLPDKDAEVVTYCASYAWHASEQAARELVAMGYTNVREYAGGKKEWMETRLPLEGEASWLRAGREKDKAA